MQNVVQNFVDVRSRKINYIADGALRRHRLWLPRFIAVSHSHVHGDELALRATVPTSYVRSLRKVPMLTYLWYDQMRFNAYEVCNHDAARNGTIEIFINNHVDDI